jgi:hypothetical protein
MPSDLLPSFTDLCGRAFLHYPLLCPIVARVHGTTLSFFVGWYSPDAETQRGILCLATLFAQLEVKCKLI